LQACSTLPLHLVPHALNPPSVRVVPRWPGITTTVKGASLGGVVARLATTSRTLAASRVLERRLGAAWAAEQVTTLVRQGGLTLDEVVLDPGTRVRLRPVPRAPNATETAIELPWRLQLSPLTAGGFAHALDAVEHDGRTELWHTRLGARVESGEAVTIDEAGAARRVRAIWARDYDQFGFVADPPDSSVFPSADGNDDDPAFRKSLNSRDRMTLVHESSNFALRRNGRAWDPRVVDVDRLMLSALGGWLDSEFSAPALPDGPFSLSEWKHRATIGRDHEVKVVYAGFLFPFGHHASLVKVTERKFTGSLPGNPAVLYQRFFLIVRDQARSYSETRSISDQRDYVPFKGAKKLDLVMPLQTVSILTRVTPVLDSPQNLFGTGGFVFFPSVDGSPYLFRVLAVDRLGNTVEYSAPLMFVERDHNLFAAGELPAVVRAYWDAAAGLRRHSLGGQRVGFAPNTAGDRGLDTELNTQALFWDALVVPQSWNVPQDDARFFPVLREADAVVPAMNSLTGSADPIRVSYPAHFAAKGLADNAANIFLAVNGAPRLDFTGKGDRSGGFATPNVAITGISGSSGPVGGELAKAIGGQTKPADFFSGITAKLFGLVPLVDLLEAVGLGPDDFPSFLGKAIDRAVAFLDDLARIERLATEVEQRFAAEADPHLTQARTLLNGIATPAAAIVTAVGAGDLASAGAQATTLAGGLDALAAALDAATLLPGSLRNESLGVVRRLAEHTEDVGDLLGVLQQFVDGLTLPPVVTARLHWSTTLKAWPGSGPIFQPKSGNWQSDPAAGATLDLAVEVQAPTKGGKPPTALVTCSITPFELRLIGDEPFIALRIEKIEFLLAPGRKPDVNVVFAEPNGIVFGGPLAFVNVLQEVIPFDGFSDPPYLEVDPSGIRAGFDLPIPSLAIGVFSLCNISLGAEVRVPFIDDSLDFRFNFCTRENPFRLTVWLFGGGGFFAITITPEKVRVLEAAFEFGAAVALDFGVASGSIEVMAGVYFKLEDDEAQLTGYFRMRGEVDVLGLISASIELYLELSYEFASGKAVGRASISIEVEVLFLSFSVSIEVEKKFKGSNQDPSFAQIMGPPVDGVRPWDEYCEAFIAA
ncbi:MAG: hypothetical protein REI45_12235, partial [Propionicimonas sp.]|nr:hypothetical protein [Propionicimonas sp.]